MWLLNSGTFELNFFYDNKTPHYAILSHVWGDNEVSFQQINGSQTEIQNHAGYMKIWKCCEQAANHGFEFVWIDTCCIDKTNSAELSEAINSMFKWYQDSTECYVYLEDVTSLDDLPASRWFTRGWTLQELLAPASAIFLNKDWQEIGTKASLAKAISLITNIPTRVILGQESEEFSVAQVMSWAANRETTRVEDVGYSLLGIFGVNMPMIYGEGEKAFARLQHEIIKGSTDQSIFAWSLRGPNNTEFREVIDRGAFAQSPADFVGCGSIVRTDSKGNPEFALNNKGLRIEVDLIPPPHHKNYYTAYLNCKKKDPEQAGDGRLGILLHKYHDDQYVRVDPHVLRTNLSNDIEGKWRTSIYIVEPGSSSIGPWKWSKGVSKRSPRLRPLYSQCTEHGFLLADNQTVRQRRQTYNSSQNRIAYEKFETLVLRFAHESTPEVQFAVLFGTSNDRVWSDIETHFGDETLADIVDSYFEPEPLTTQHSRRYQARENIQDRATAPLQDGSLANVVVKKVLVSGNLEYVAEITITKLVDLKTE
ncbi:HET-domain-containing protein [Stipitochalara longipes BDJ]|nr:HET-domain-containing protein [Stipitochalara longipes BDJ]